jgi:carbamoyl-phosphate synthase large subunit
MIFPVKRLVDLGFEILATEGTADVLRRNGIASTRVRKHRQGRGPDGEPTVVDRIIAGEVDMVINTPSGPAARQDGYEIRAATTSVDRPMITTIQQFSAAVQAIEAARNEPVRVTSLQEHGIRLRALRVEQDAEAAAVDRAAGAGISADAPGVVL